MVAEHPVIDPAPSAPVASADSSAEAAALFLSHRDTPCPACGYNLRGVAGPACPECNEAIVLELAGHRRRWAPVVFALLAFAWLLTAGVLNTSRHARAAWEIAHSPSAVSIGSLFGSFGGPFTGSAGPLTGSFSQPLTGSSYQSYTTRGPDGRTTTTIIQQIPAPPPANWSLVPAGTWARLGWSLFLLAAGTVGVLAVARHHRRALSARGWTRLSRLAVLAFALYGGFHVYLFVMEWR